MSWGDGIGGVLDGHRSRRSFSVDRCLYVGHPTVHFALKDPHGLTYRSGDPGQPLGAEQQHHHSKKNQQVPATDPPYQSSFSLR